MHYLDLATLAELHRRELLAEAARQHLLRTGRASSAGPGAVPAHRPVAPLRGLAQAARFVSDRAGRIADRLDPVNRGSGRLDGVVPSVGEAR
jgi:hypothetical protein